MSDRDVAVELLTLARQATERAQALLEQLQTAENQAEGEILRAESARLRDSARAVRAERAGYADLIAELRRTVAQLERAMQTRSVIEQAKGIVMASRRCDADAAFDVLRRISQNQNRKLHDIAAEVVARVVTAAGDGDARVGDIRGRPGPDSSPAGPGRRGA